jgi:hypothetical protein
LWRVLNQPRQRTAGLSISSTTTSNLYSTPETSLETTDRVELEDGEIVPIKASDRVWRDDLLIDMDVRATPERADEIALSMRDVVLTRAPDAELDHRITGPEDGPFVSVWVWLDGDLVALLLAIAESEGLELDDDDSDYLTASWSIDDDQPRPPLIPAEVERFSLSYRRWRSPRRVRRTDIGQ